jgi:hypothetical protein
MSYKKGDKRKMFGVWFTYNGEYWTMDFIDKIKNFKKYSKD